MHWAEYGIKEGRNKSVETDLSTTEVTSYIERYPDLKAKYGKLGFAEQLKAANEHWLTIGHPKENRNGHQAERITKQQAYCYLKKYPDLVKAFGMTSTSWIKAQEHWLHEGFK